MRTLVYKRTHKGDPDSQGEFGCNGCMGCVRAWPFEAVIGVGGLGSEAVGEGIDYKLTWIGIGAHKRVVDWQPYPTVVFDHFRLLDQKGADFREVAPALADRIYGKHVRTTMTFSLQEADEIERLLARAKKYPPSPALKLLHTSVVSMRVGRQGRVIQRSRGCKPQRTC